MANALNSGRGFVIRTRRNVDVAEASAALVAVHASDGYPVEGVAHPEKWLNPEGLLMAWVAETDGRIVGHAAVSRSNGEDAVAIWMEKNGVREEDVAVLARLFVVPDARMQSLGEHLMRAAAEYAHRNGVRLVLDVMTKDASAIRLYERLGWRQIGRTAHLFGQGQQTEAICYVSPEAPS